MESMEYINDICKEALISKEDLASIIDYLGYIAQDNHEYEARSFLDRLEDAIEEM